MADAAPATTPLPASAKCPRTPGGRPAKDVAIALGDGPAFPVLGMAEAPLAPGGVAQLDNNVRRGGLYAHKTLWAVSPDAPGELVVRGASLRTGAPLEFLIDDERVDRLMLPHQDRQWTYAVTATLLPGPGCLRLPRLRPGRQRRHHLPRRPRLTLRMALGPRCCTATARHARTACDTGPALGRLLMTQRNSYRSGLEQQRGRRGHFTSQADPLVVLPGVGHLCNLEAPDEFNAAVRTFLHESH